MAPAVVAPFVGLFEAPARIGELPRELLEHLAQYFDLPSAVAFCKSSTSGKSAAGAVAFRAWACRAGARRLRPRSDEWTGATGE